MDIDHFRLIDRVKSLSPDRGTIVCEADVPIYSSVFEGHFPGFPLLPGVLQAELMAQTAGLLVLELARRSAAPLVVGFDRLRFRQFVPPAAMLTAQAELLHRGDGYAVCRTSLWCDGDRVSDGEARFRLVEFRADKMREAFCGTAELLLKAIATQAAE